MAIVARVLEDDELAARQWTEELADALYQGDDGAYINFFGPHHGDRIEAAYPGETLARLRRIKATYDPMNLFPQQRQHHAHLNEPSSASASRRNLPPDV